MGSEVAGRVAPEGRLFVPVLADGALDWPLASAAPLRAWAKVLMLRGEVRYLGVAEVAYKVLSVTENGEEKP
jgi:hypothetical protein